METQKNDKKKLNDESVHQLITYSFDDTNKWIPYFWTLFAIALSLLAFIVDYSKDFELGILIHLLLALFWIPGLILHLTYWIKNNKAIVTIDTRVKTIVYEQKGRITKFSSAEIIDCKLISAKPPQKSTGTNFWDSYKYILLKLKNEETIIITSFITEPKNILEELKLNYTMDKTMIPFLPF